MHGDVTVTLSGFVATTPTLFRSQSGNDFTSFRIAQTRRYLDRERGEWVDGRTLWFTVKAWKNTARNVAVSLHKGDPVVVTGRLSLDEWAGPDGPRASLVVEANALGPDLSLGEARFARTVHRREDGATGSPESGDASSTGAGQDAPARAVRSSDRADTPTLDDPWTLGDVDAALAGEQEAPPEDAADEDAQAERLATV
jgi:single-strand DNA-binding protein